MCVCGGGGAGSAWLGMHACSDAALHLGVRPPSPPLCLRSPGSLDPAVHAPALTQLAWRWRVACGGCGEGGACACVWGRGGGAGAFKAVRPSLACTSTHVPHPALAHPLHTHTPRPPTPPTHTPTHTPTPTPTHSSSSSSGGSSSRGSRGSSSSGGSSSRGSKGSSSAYPCPGGCRTAPGPQATQTGCAWSPAQSWVGEGGERVCEHVHVCVCGGWGGVGGGWGGGGARV